MISPKHVDFNDHLPLIPEIAIVKHIPGQNDFMSGGVFVNTHVLPQVAALAPHDHLDCVVGSEIHFKCMPWRILTLETLLQIPGLFGRPRAAAEMLCDGFTTTVRGLERAIQQIYKTRSDGHDIDMLLIGALARRGGRLPATNDWSRVFYPEDIVPIITDYDMLDLEYWKELYEQGDVWNTMPGLQAYLDSRDTTKRKRQKARTKNEWCFVAKP